MYRAALAACLLAPACQDVHDAVVTDGGASVSVHLSPVDAQGPPQNFVAIALFNDGDSGNIDAYPVTTAIVSVPPKVWRIDAVGVVGVIRDDANTTHGLYVELPNDVLVDITVPGDGLTLVDVTP